MDEQKIIYIMGADFSGTTLLDFMLGSSQNTASIGEIAAFLKPTSSAHLKPRCSCGKECGIWKIDNFKDDPYDYLFTYHRVNTLIDSSKHIGWVNSQIQLAHKKGRKTSVVVIWKDSKDYAKSCANRGNPEHWAHKWINYYKALLQSELPFYSVSLDSLLNNPDETVKGICEYTKIPYSRKMLEYDKHEGHHAVFGSATARMKLHKKGSNEWKAEKEYSLRKDYKNENMLKPAFPTPKQVNEIKQISNLLKPNEAKRQKLLKGHKALLLAKVRKSMERSVYLLGIEPSQFKIKLQAALSILNR